MSSNRLKYDKCFENEHDNRNSGQLNWVLDSQRFVPPPSQKACMEDNLINGNTIGNNNIPNRVDIETALFGIDNKTNSECKVPKDLKNIDTVAKQPNCNIVGQRNNNTNVHPLTEQRCEASIDYLDSVSNKKEQNELEIIKQYN